ncbi:uncharacterized protein [Elaeis guineensis]|uniref:uncharacterized protein isoform X2 n=1 Tax=Elaeis guineensis var. tenera TaxID=51953 RepID=UPI003C6D6E8E
MFLMDLEFVHVSYGFQRLLGCLIFCFAVMECGGISSLPLHLIVLWYVQMISPLPAFEAQGMQYRNALFLGTLALGALGSSFLFDHSALTVLQGVCGSRY